MEPPWVNRRKDGLCRAMFESNIHELCMIDITVSRHKNAERCESRCRLPEKALLATKAQTAGCILVAPSQLFATVKSTEKI